MSCSATLEKPWHAEDERGHAIAAELLAALESARAEPDGAAAALRILQKYCVEQEIHNYATDAHIAELTAGNQVLGAKLAKENSAKDVQIQRLTTREKTLEADAERYRQDYVKLSGQAATMAGYCAKLSGKDGTVAEELTKIFANDRTYPDPESGGGLGSGVGGSGADTWEMARDGALDIQGLVSSGSESSPSAMELPKPADPPLLLPKLVPHIVNPQTKRRRVGVSLKKAKGRSNLNPSRGRSTTLEAEYDRGNTTATELMAALESARAGPDGAAAMLRILQKYCAEQETQSCAKDADIEELTARNQVLRTDLMKSAKDVCIQELKAREKALKADADRFRQQYLTASKEFCTITSQYVALLKLPDGHSDSGKAAGCKRGGL
ncbi:hypothetical protein DFH06DRAFT_1132351 [Mycena polygramma]|nr:hypothetical protein DFH06DRAFT_1132351 [Mycena polygramma]